MDLAIYISELLGLRGEVNLPGIGYFAQVRSNGYYNEHENKFYPPGHLVNFRPQLVEDDILAKYISEKKHISLASSIYFIDKYVSSLKQQVALQDVDIAGLGYLQSKDSTLTFKANNAGRENDPAFYGFPPVRTYKLGQQPEETPAPVVTELPKVTPPPVEEEVPFKETPSEVITEGIIPVEKTDPSEPELYTLEQTEYPVDEPVSRNSRNIRIVIGLIVAIIVLSLVAVYQYYPGMFDGLKYLQNNAKPAVVKSAAKPDTALKAQDTVAKTTLAPDTATKPVSQSAIIDSARSRVELIGCSFAKKQTKAADAAIRNYKSIGIDAKIVTDAPGTRIKITIGTYATMQEAENARIEFLKSKKVSNDIYPLEIKPKK